MGRDDPAGPAGHPDQVRWNARYGQGFEATFEPHPLAVLALSLPLPDGPVADLACGPSGSALLAEQARRRGLGHLIRLVHADLATWRPLPGGYALVLGTGYWDRAVFAVAADAVAPRGALGWEAFTADARNSRPALCPDWCLEPGEPASLLPAGFAVLGQHDLPGSERGTRRRLLARRPG